GYNNKVNCSSEEVDEMISELNRCTEFFDDKFTVSYPKNRWEWVDKGRVRPYRKCFGHHFLTVITADQKVYVCCHLSNMSQYCFGDLSKASFKETWKSEQRKEAYKSITFKNCPNPCMMDNHNKLLWDIHQPIMHSDFL
ncbi:MAG: SPASM domain-containing protein, partial [Nanoarchaeota archaeon]